MRRDVGGYYSKKGYTRVGTVFEAMKKRGIE
jgi:hypothetical protein